MPRLIDADALKEKVWDADTRCGYVQVVDVGDIDNAPTIEPKPQWIPLTERLPEPYQYCLWTRKDGYVVFKHCDGLFSEYTAWMPLPEPYREEGGK